MATSDLIAFLLANAGFTRQLRRVIVESVGQQFPALQAEQSLFSEPHDWPYLLMCSTLLAQSSGGRAQDAALRIAQHVLITESDDRLKAAACVTLDMLTNQPAIQLAMERGLIRTDYSELVPLPLRLDWIQRSVRYSIVLGNNTIVHSNRFQRMLWDEVEVSDWLSISAPTSAGKSFILINWLGEYLRDRKRQVVVYVVPTRALIQQVQLDLESHFNKQQFKGIKVSCLPLSSQVSDCGHTVFVLTQERLHILLNNLANGPEINLLIVDEAQKVGDGARGVLLQIVVEMVMQHSPLAKFLFASPTTDNPEVLLEDAPAGSRKKGFRSEQVTVNQNLLWVSQDALHPKKWSVELCVSRDRVRLGDIQLRARPDAGQPKRLAFVAHALGGSGAKNSGGNLVYVNGPGEGEKVAKLLHGLVGAEEDVSSHPDIAELIKLVRKVVHPEYALAEVVGRGVAFHYGNMPLLIRNEIERLFKENIIRFLVCTSTLIEGVNLPAKTIFVRGPEKGQGIPMGEADFWNLAGRAGRMGKEFQGNVVCIDPTDRSAWPEPPPTERVTQKIERSTDVVLQDSEGFLAFIRGDAAAIDKKLVSKYEHVLSYLFKHVLHHGSLRGSRLASRYPEQFVRRLDEVLIAAKEELKTPIEVVERNPGISPLAMDELLNYFIAYEKPVEELLPRFPEDSQAAAAFKRIFSRINKYLAPQTAPFGVVDKMVFARAILVVNWMRGHPLARLISQRETRYPDEPLPGLIRNTMDDVERVARFLAPKYVSCYTDILRHFLVSTKRAALAEALPDLTLWLEFGASQQTQLSLMSLGLSRTSAILLSEFIPDDGFDQNACVAWLRETNLRSLDLPSLVMRETERVKKAIAPSDGSGEG